MTEQDWTEWFAKSFAVFLNGDALRSARRRRAAACATTAFCCSSTRTSTVVHVHAAGADRGEQRWAVVIDTVETPTVR